MLNLLSWNVQWCRGIDGRVDPARIARTARDIADFDVLCLQEVAIGFRSLPGSAGEDQFAALAAALPDHRGYFGPATDLDDGAGGRRQFGNAIFTRLPVHQVFRHLLPWPPDPATPSMQRLALELVIETSGGPLRVVTTHLEYYSPSIRMAQVHALRALHSQACGHAARPRPGGVPGEPFDVSPSPANTVICGDFNFVPHGTDYTAMTAPFDDATAPLHDAWAECHPGREHPPTVGVHEDRFPRECWDFAFVSRGLVRHLGQVRIIGDTDASDHQPLALALRGDPGPAPAILTDREPDTDPARPVSCPR